MRITSTQNSVVKYVRSLGRASVRRQEGVFLVEGVRLVREALDTGQRPAIALYDPSLLERTDEGSLLLQRLHEVGGQVHDVPEHVLAAAAQTETPAGVLVVLPAPPPRSLGTVLQFRFGIVLDGVADPGNAGTILRTADAAGAGYVIAMRGSVDLFSPKVVRAGMGAHFRLPLIEGVAWDRVPDDLAGVTLVAASTAAEHTIYDFPWPDQCALVIGSEAHGLSAEATLHVDQQVRIPMRQGVESLNASVAAGIVMYSVLGPVLLVPDMRYR